MKNTYTANKSNEKQTRMQLLYEECGMGQGHEQGEALQPSIINVYSHLYSFT